MTLYGGIEAGGTKFVCAVGSGPRRHSAPRCASPPPNQPKPFSKPSTSSRSKSLTRGPLTAIGIASFGPVDPNPASPTFRPHHHHAQTRLGQHRFRRHDSTRFQRAVGFDTDVNGAALSEGRWGAAQGLDTFVYFTIGTGIGGGAMVNGRLLHGLIHPEMGHISLPHDWEKDPYPGKCPYHGDCFEGMAAGPAIEARWQTKGQDLPADHPAWELEAHYIAQALRSVICTLSPQRIILGGGVMDQPQLFPLVRQKTLETLNGYVQSPPFWKTSTATLSHPR